MAKKDLAKSKRLREEEEDGEREIERTSLTWKVREAKEEEGKIGFRLSELEMMSFQLSFFSLYLFIYLFKSNTKRCHFGPIKIF